MAILRKPGGNVQNVLRVDKDVFFSARRFMALREGNLSSMVAYCVNKELTLDSWELRKQFPLKSKLKQRKLL
jgi:hypothetical protein